MTQALDRQVNPMPHASPQPLQLAGSCEKPESSYSQPSVTAPLQLLKPPLQLPIWQLPAVQAAVACCGAHTFLHPPQFAVSV